MVLHDRCRSPPIAAAEAAIAVPMSRMRQLRIAVSGHGLMLTICSAGLEDYKPPANAFMMHGWMLNGVSGSASNGHASEGHVSNGSSEHPSGHSVPLTHSASIPQTGPMAIPQRPLPPLPPSMLSLSGHSPGAYILLRMPAHFFCMWMSESEAPYTISELAAHPL